MVDKNKSRVERRRQVPMLIGDPEPAAPADRPRIESDGRFAGPAQSTPPDPRAVIEELRRQLRAEEEKTLNSVDAVLGARAIAAQARAETQEVFYRLHVRETELEQLKELLGSDRGSAGPAAGPADGLDAASATPGSSDEPPRPAAALRMLVTSVRSALKTR